MGAVQSELTRVHAGDVRLHMALEVAERHPERVSGFLPSEEQHPMSAIRLGRLPGLGRIDWTDYSEQLHNPSRDRVNVIRTQTHTPKDAVPARLPPLTEGPGWR
jgi:hypothetical protein